MKKLCLLLLVATVAVSAMAHDDGGKKGKKSKHKQNNDQSWNDDRDRRTNNDRNGDWRYENNRGNNNQWNNNGNVPRKVRDAFNRDFPSARNTNWSKNRGVWTASFRRSGLFGGNQTISYQANGRRVDNNPWAGNNNRNKRSSGDRGDDRDDD